MDIVCPECQGNIVIRNDEKAVCAVHGGEYSVLFSRVNAVPSHLVSPPEPVDVSGQACAYHPDVAAAHACVNCSSPICELCGFSWPNGGQVCPKCMERPELQTAMATSEQTAPPGSMCATHPEVAAVQKCQSCGAFVCATCDFALPGGAHICPSCAASPDNSKLPQKKKTLLIWSYVCAIAATLALAVFFIAAINMSEEPDEAAEAALGLLFMGGVLVPGVAGISLGIGVFDKRRPTPVSAWIAVIWNALHIGVFFLLTVLGAAMG